MPNDNTNTCSADNALGHVIRAPHIHSLIVGSGAAGLNAALQLKNNGIDSVEIITEGLQAGTSINTGSDKQTYYKLSLCSDAVDSPATMAETYISGGSMHGDLALVEASTSAQAFLNLVTLGVPFPRDKYGMFVGYKTDHDPAQRATSIGPYTSKAMCEALIKEVKRCEIPVHENMIVTTLLTVDTAQGKRACGVMAISSMGSLHIFTADNVIFAVGGPGGLYQTSVYPTVHTGAIGVALMAGAKAQSLPESQYGLASIGFRWNVSGTYMQVIPRFISTDADGVSNPQEFLTPYFNSTAERDNMVFLKGYQWPFDSRKSENGSSIVDILTYIETAQKGRRVFLDFRSNPGGYELACLSSEARIYLEKSGAFQDTPLKRLLHMNPGAVSLYQDHGIDLHKEMLEIAVCAQHNNGGLAADHWWHSTNIQRLFPVGEVNGSHGVFRPGGSALNSGQVGGLRLANYIANVAAVPVESEKLQQSCDNAVSRLQEWLRQAANATLSWREERQELQQRMSRFGAHIRDLESCRQAFSEAEAQWTRISNQGCSFTVPSDAAEALTTRQLCFAHLVYLSSLIFALENGVGSRGSALVLDKIGSCRPQPLGEEWNFVPENVSFRSKVQETVASENGDISHEWVDCRPIPDTRSLWFETTWAEFRAGKIYQ